MKRGRVILVGAGPGAPDLITVRGRRALRQADVVVYDALASHELLELAPPAAERINVGKRGHDAPTRSQEEINALMVSRARAGLAVVRLKGGDPFVFGRGGEEASACHAAGLPFEVVPGVSAAIGALTYAGIPVTDRRFAASFAVVTGHKDPSRVREAIRWAELAQAADTLVVLMGMRNLEEITTRLLSGGRSADTPAAVIMQGTLPEQRVVEATLGDLAEATRAVGLSAPAAVVIGDVVRLRQELSWFERLPLFGRRVLVTRQVAQAGPLLRALQQRGAVPVVIPMIRTEPIRGTGEIAQTLGQLGDYDLLLLTSANAARYFAARVEEAGHQLSELHALVACVGPASARAAEEVGLVVHKLPSERYDAEGLLERLRGELQLQGRHVLLPRAEQAREVLPEGLRAEGAQVQTLAVYRTAQAPFDAEALRDSLVQGRLDALTFASPSAVRHFTEAVGAPGLVAARRTLVAAIGPVTAAALSEAGLPASVLAERANAEALAEALATEWGKSGESQEANE